MQIRWPDRDLPGFAAQAIPLRTRSIRLTTQDPQSVIADLRLLIREGGSTATASTTMELQAGSSYGVTAEAFEEAAPADDSVPIAQATAANVPIRKSKLTRVPLTLTAAYAPAITSLSVTEGPYGTTVDVLGANFGATPGFPFAVTFGGAVATEAARSGDDKIAAKVPVGAVSGNVVVHVDGVPSTSVALFTITQGLDATLMHVADTYGPNGLDVSVSSVTTEQGIEVAIR